MRRIFVVALALGALLIGVVPVGATDAWRTVGEGSVRGRDAELEISARVKAPAAFRLLVDHSQDRDVEVAWQLTCRRSDPPGRRSRSGTVTLTPPDSRVLEIPAPVEGCEAALSARAADGGGGILRVRLQAR